MVRQLFFLAQVVFLTLQAFTWGNLYRLPNCSMLLLLPTDACPNVPDGVMISSVVLVLALMELLWEVYRSFRVTWWHFGFWRVFQCVLIPIVIISGVTSIEATQGLFFNQPVAALQYVPVTTSIAAFMTWYKSLYYMRAYPGTGGLVRLVLEITYEMRWMMMLVVIGIMAAMTAFFVLPPHQYFDDPQLEAATDSFYDMLFFTFSMMLSSYDSTTITAPLSQSLAMAFLALQAVLLLNALIALMSESAAKNQENIKVLALRERAGLLMETELVMGSWCLSGPRYRPRWLHALVAERYVKVGGSAGAEAGAARVGKPADLLAVGQEGTGGRGQAAYAELLAAVRALQAEQQLLAAKMDSLCNELNPAIASSLPASVVESPVGLEADRPLGLSSFSFASPPGLARMASERLSAVAEAGSPLPPGAGSPGRSRTPALSLSRTNSSAAAGAEPPQPQQPTASPSSSEQGLRQLRSSPSMPAAWWKDMEVTVEAGRHVGTGEPRNAAAAPRPRYKK